ncbi:PRC-barrel domain-containing protein [uncultured Methanosphaera sp.]|uniref:PRC-barrel domain-containing protein n=1 Tax=uncultured Methanosphaera sp. TaxID=262501 RepID=UPI000DC22AEC|nr:PRC-barrel domain-containing protein [uncultured Methanosphaera sp.]RAP43636.1 MAG: photosystem reaction center subunit H [Methanosphaera sp. SHI1033]
MRLLDDIIGKEVLDNSASVMGKVKDIELDTSSNKLESIIVTKGGISESIGISKNEIIVPFEMIKRIGDKILLKKTIDDAEIMVEELENDL